MHCLLNKFELKHFFLTGLGYDQSNESDILLLDISNNDEYVWNNDFVPLQSSTLSPSPSPSPSPSLTKDNPQTSDNKSTVIAAVVGSLVGSAILSLGGFLLYRHTRNKKKQDPVIPTPGDYRNPERETLTNHQPMIIPTPVINNNNYNQGQQGSLTDHEPIKVVNNDKNNHGREAVPITDEKSSSQGLDELKDELKSAKQEIQDLRQMILQNNKQASNSNG